MIKYSTFLPGENMTADKDFATIKSSSERIALTW